MKQLVFEYSAARDGDFNEWITDLTAKGHIITQVVPVTYTLDNETPLMNLIAAVAIVNHSIK